MSRQRRFNSIYNLRPKFIIHHRTIETPLFPLISIIQPEWCLIAYQAAAFCHMRNTNKSEISDILLSGYWNRTCARISIHNWLINKSDFKLTGICSSFFTFFHGLLRIILSIGMILYLSHRSKPSAILTFPIRYKSLLHPFIMAMPATSLRGYFISV